VSAKSTNDNVGCSCTGTGCASLIILILILTALWFGLPTPWGKLNIDIFPPRIWDMEKQ
jgi:hypothetical protein